MRHSIRLLFIQCRFTSTNLKESTVRWFYATDIPNTKPQEPNYSRGKKQPEKFLPFSLDDSRRLETFHQLSIKQASLPSSFRSIPVNEDYLFEVDLEKRELKSTYWEGPTYEVRRGLWFNSDNIPLNEELTEELETSYHKIKPGRHQEKAETGVYQDVHKLSSKHKEGKLVIYTDEKTAFILPELYGGKLQLNLLRSNLAQAIQFGATKVIRGYEAKHSIATKAKENVEKEVRDTSTSLGKLTDLISWEMSDVFKGLNPLYKVGEATQSEENSDDVLKREMETDYENDSTDENCSRSNHREVDHLVFCVHGIGQKLGKKYQYVNFAHTVNLLRGNMKKFYSQSDKLKKTNRDKGHDDWKTNCRVQVLPITWRDQIGFNTDDIDINSEDPDFPTLNEITVDGVKSLRKMLGDVALDVLLYGEPFYRRRIMSQVSTQLNDLYNLYKARNPNFQGQVSIIGHSLGSLVVFDILSRQNEHALDFDVTNYFSIGSPVGVFKLIQKTKIGPQLGTENNSDGGTDRPKCRDLYNIYHVCDPIAYRMEPLIDKSMSQFQQVYLPHWSDNQITAKIWELGESLSNTVISEGDEKRKKEVVKLSERQLSLLTKLNYSGRVDYSFRPNFLEVDLISSIMAHVSYFEEMDMTAFFLREILTRHNKVTEKEVKRIVPPNDR